LWASREKRDWHDALERYWRDPAVLRDLKLNEYMEALDAEVMKRLDQNEWFEFLENKYFPWKFTGTYLPQRLDDLRENDPATLSQRASICLR
jgi:hypothetical protein